MILLSPRVQALGIFQRFVPISVPMGLGFVAGYLESKGEPIVVYDEETDETPFDEARLSELVAREKASPPYIFGFSSVTAGAFRAFEMAKLIRRKYPDSLIVMGGVHPTLVPSDPLENSPADVVVLGQGEQIMEELIAAFRQGVGEFDDIDGIVFKRDGQLVHTQPRKKFLGLNDIPDFPYHLFEEHIEKYDLGWIVSSHGCPFDCIFCSQRAITGTRVSYSENDKVIRQIKLLNERYGVEHIWFADDNLSIKKKRIIALCGDIVAAGLHKKVSFDAQTRADGVNPEVLAAMKRANIRTIAFGLEVASDRLMKLIKKGETLEECISAVRQAKESGLRVAGTFILGWPDETDGERRATYDLAVELDLDVARFNTATPYPGTELYDMVKDEPGFNPGPDWKHMNTVGVLTNHPFKKPLPLSYVPTNISERKLRRMVLRYNLWFSLRPKRVIQLLRDGVNLGGHFSLSKGWYLRPKELLLFMQFGFRILGSLVRTIV